MTNRYDISLMWEKSETRPNREGLMKVLREHSGLELVPERRLVEMLVVKQVKSVMTGDEKQIKQRLCQKSGCAAPPPISSKK